MISVLNGAIELLNRGGLAHGHFAVAMFLQVGILVLVLLGVDLCLRHHVRAVFRYWMWMLVLVKLLLPVTLALPTSPAWWLADRWPAGVSSAPETTAASPPLVATGPAPGILKPSERLPGVTAAAIAPDAGTRALPSPPSGAVVLPEPAAVTLSHLQATGWGFLAWLMAVAILLGVLVRRTARVRRLLQAAAEAPDDLQELLRQCHGAVRLAPHRVRLKISHALGSPAICGLWRPTILLPGHLVDKLDRQQLRLVFLHELAHWKRGDLHVNCLQTVLQILHFYNPAVWVANAILRRLREQAVDEAVLVTSGPHSENYPSTLLDIAAMAGAPAELGLRLTGVVESRKAVAQRIRRIVTRRIPTSARLGLAGLIVILLMGTILLPMSAGERSGRRPVVRPVADSKPHETAPSTATTDESPAAKAALSGRITDETGAPVTDAKLTLSDAQRQTRLETTTDPQGHYQFHEIPQPGEYHLEIRSERWIGLTRYDELLRIHLNPEARTVHDFQLNRACQARIQVVDEKGNPIRGAMVHRMLPSDEKSRNHELVSTDKEGWATLGGLKPSETEYLIGVFAEDYGFARLQLKLNDPQATTVASIMLFKGIEIPGKALCSDGKPPAGWRILALPTWWDFGSYPMGQVIDPDGAFTLPHIVPGKYNVTISVPSGQSMTTPHQVLADASLTEMPRPLAVTLDYPSPESLTAISGKIRYVGGPLQAGVHIVANSEDRKYHASAYLRPGEQEFRLEPLPRGVYDVRFESTEIEPKNLRFIAAPTENLEVEIKLQARTALQGMVVRAGTRQAVSDFRVRVLHVRTLRGPNYVAAPRWHEFKATDGRFSIEVPGPGIYMVLVAAEGLAWVRSEPINTDQQAGKPLQIELPQGTPLSGLVVDEEGQPVDGATVIPLSKAIGTMSSAPGGFVTEDGAVQTSGGRFTLENLAPGRESLKVTHPDYCFTIVQDIEVSKQPAADALTITLTRGGTVRGRVYDAQGRPEPNVTLYFQSDIGYGHGDGDGGRLATVTTDATGAYEVHGLPEQLCYVQRPEQWKYLGVVRQAILPANGKTQTLDFGGSARLTGRLVVSGKPLADRKVLLAGGSPNFGIFRAYAQTSGDGSFTFWGVQPGERTLYYDVPGQPNDWVRVRDLQVTAQGGDLGTIDHRSGRVTVELQPAGGQGTEGPRVSLQVYDPIWTCSNERGVLAPRTTADAPFVFENVPPGKYQILGFLPKGPSVRQVVETSLAQLDAQVKLELPSGTASLSGRVAPEVCEPGGCNPLKLWSRDRRLLAYIAPKDDGTYRVENLPAGDYVVVRHDTRDAQVLLNVSLQERENKTLDLTSGNVSSSGEVRGCLFLTVFTPNGIPLPGCQAHVEGPEGKLSPHSSQEGRVVFVGPLGAHQLLLSYPGFQPVQRAIELRPAGKDGVAGKDCSLQVILQPEGK